MKRRGSITILAIIAIVCFSSILSAQANNRYARSAGYVEVEFMHRTLETNRFNLRSTTNEINREAYTRLFEEASKAHENVIDIVDMQISHIRTESRFNRDFHYYNASGEVILALPGNTNTPSRGRLIHRDATRLYMEFFEMELVTRIYETNRFNLASPTNEVHREARELLLEEARRRYGNVIDIDDLLIQFDRTTRRDGRGEVYHYFVSGQIVTSTNPRQNRRTPSDSEGRTPHREERREPPGVTDEVALLQNALSIAIGQALSRVPGRSTIAIVEATAPTMFMTNALSHGLENILLGLGHTVLDKEQADRLIAEQNNRTNDLGLRDFNPTQQRVNIDFTITANIDMTGNNRRLNIRVVNFATGAVVGSSSERF
jgi:hypothetical protein